VAIIVEQGKRGVMVELGAPRAKVKNKEQGMIARSIRNENENEKHQEQE